MSETELKDEPVISILTTFMKKHLLVFWHINCWYNSTRMLYMYSKIIKGSIQKLVLLIRMHVCQHVRNYCSVMSCYVTLIFCNLQCLFYCLDYQANFTRIAHISTYILSGNATYDTLFPPVTFIFLPFQDFFLVSLLKPVRTLAAWCNCQTIVILSP